MTGKTKLLTANLRKQRFAETVGEPCARWVDAVAAADEIDRLRHRVKHLEDALTSRFNADWGDREHYKEWQRAQ